MGSVLFPPLSTSTWAYETIDESGTRMAQFSPPCKLNKEDSSA